VKLADRVAARAVDRRDVRRASAVSQEEFAELLLNGRSGTTRTKSGALVSERRILGIPGWYRGCRYLSEQVAFLPWKHYRDQGSQRMLRPSPPWMTYPDVDLPWPMLVEFWMLSMLNRGNAYAFKLRTVSGQVTGLRPIHPDRVRAVGRDPLGGGKVFVVRNGNDDVALTSRELLHIPGMSSDSIVGVDPLTYQADALGLVVAADEFAARSYEGSHLRSYLSVPEVLTVDQARVVKAQWEEAHAGIKSASGFGVLSGGAKYETLSMTPEQVQLLETRKFNIGDIARLIGCPPHKLYDLERATFSNIEHQAIEATTDSIRPWTQRIETWIDFDRDLTPDGNFTEATLDGLMRGDAKTEAEAMAASITGGWMTPKRAAEIKNLPAPDELDYHIRPLNYAVVGDPSTDPISQLPT